MLVHDSRWIGWSKLLKHGAEQGCQGVPILGVGDDFPSQELLGPLIGSAEVVQKPVHVLDVGRHQRLLWRDVGHASSPCLWVEELKNGHFNWRTGRMPPLAFCERERVIS